MTSYFEISHTPSGMGWNYKKVDENSVPVELKQGLVAASVRERKGFFASIAAVVSVDDAIVDDLDHRSAVSTMRSRLADTLSAIYKQKLADANLKEPTVSIPERIVSIGVDVLFG